MKARKRRKQAKLRALQLDFYEQLRESPDEPLPMNIDLEKPYETIDQRRHERRVFGHDVADCTCTGEEAQMLILWRQSAGLDPGVGQRMHRRYRNRMGRRRR